MTGPPLWLVVGVPGALLLRLGWTRRARARRSDFIRTYELPPGLVDRFAAQYPQLSARDRHLVARGLRQFFTAYLDTGFRPVAMPSQVVDTLWHEFILYTRHYQHFCRKAFGRFLHHTPAVALGANRQTNTRLRRVWQQTCRQEGIDPSRPKRLPLIFLLDEQLGISDGFRYALDCHGLRQHDSPASTQCVSDFSDSGSDGLFDSWGDWFSSDGSSGDDGGSSGCGGDGGGCGGD